MENNLPSDQLPVPQSHAIFSKKRVILLVLVIMVMIAMGYSVLRFWPSQQVNYTPQTQTKNTKSVTSSSSAFFQTGISEKQLASVVVADLPNSRDIRGVIEYDGRIWYSGDGSLIEYDPELGEIVRYSNLTKVNCDSNLVIVGGFLYVPCRSLDENKETDSVSEYPLYQLYKINPKTYSVEKIYKKSDGLLNQSNFEVYSTGDRYIWIATFEGVAKLDTKTDAIVYYTDDLGIYGTHFGVNSIIPDGERVWAVVSANAESVGGISLYDPKTNTWKGFGPKSLKEVDDNRLDFEYTAQGGSAIKLVPGGIQVAFRDGEDPRILVEKKYSYQTDTWTTVNKVAYDGNYYDSESKRLAKEYTSLSMQGARFEDEDALTSIILHGKKYDVNGRAYLGASSVVNGKRYFLTGGSVDVLREGERLPKVLLKLPKDIDFARPHDTNPESLPTRLLTVIGSDLLFVFSPDAQEGFEGPNYFGTMQLWVIDTKSDMVISEFSDKGEYSWRLGTKFELKQDGEKYMIINASGKTILEVDPTRKKFTVVDRVIAPTRMPYPNQ